MNGLARAGRLLDEAVAARVFPGAILQVGRGDGELATRVAGHLTYAPGAPVVTARTVYDLASLTKVLCTATIAAGLVREGRLGLDDPVHRWSATWRGVDRSAVTIRQLLDHSSGLPGHRPYYERLAGREAFEAAIGAEPLAYEPGTRSVYADPGFILLGLILERAGDRPLDEQFDAWRDRHLPGAEIAFRPPADWLNRTAPTEHDPWRRRLLVGEVHDENAAAMGGVAGHAGLFGTAEAVGRSARWWMREARASAVHAAFFSRGTVAGSSRALAWDTMLPTSSCGTRMSPAAVGHTGFTGTSLWIDPASGVHVALLSNRVHPSRAGDAMARVRPSVHDAVADDLGLP